MKKVFDPRTNEYVESNNPALILLNLIQDKFHVLELEKDILPRIKQMADYCEEPVTMEVDWKDPNKP
jgi:hypothetical protein